MTSIILLFCSKLQFQHLAGACPCPFLDILIRGVRTFDQCNFTILTNLCSDESVSILQGFSTSALLTFGVA